MDQIVRPTASFWSKKGRKALKRKGWKVPSQLVRMSWHIKSAKQLQKTPEIRRFQVFFVEIEGAPRLYGKRKRDNLSRFLDDRAFLTAVFDITATG